jgi:hypothetical protein
LLRRGLSQFKIQVVDLDKLQFDAAEIAQLAAIKDTKTVANWTDRGVADPYKGPWEWKRGRGVARRYSLRDALRFALLRELVDRLQIPIPLGRRLCLVTFSEGFSPDRSGYTVVDNLKADFAAISSVTEEQLLSRLTTAGPVPCLVFRPAEIYAEVLSRADKLLTDNSTLAVAPPGHQQSNGPADRHLTPGMPPR